MADHLRPMEKLLRIPILGIEDAIVVPAVLADQFELKPELLDFVSKNPFFGLENDDPHSHIRRFYQITQTLRLNQVPDDVVNLILFPFSLKGAAETWLEKEPPNSITSWDDLVSKFLNRFYPHSETREFRKEITNFKQVFGETFTEAWERFKDLLRKCPHHGFSLLHQIYFFYNGLCQSDQDSLNTKAGGNLMMRNTQEAFTIIENKARVRTCRNKPQVSSGGGTSTQIDAITTLTKQVEALEYHFASMRETYDQNQEVAVQIMQNQMGQMADFQESPLGVLPSNTVTDPLAELNVITSMDVLTLDGSFISHSNFLFYQDEDVEPETITEVVEIPSSKSTPLVPPPETPPLSTPKPKENLDPNPHEPFIPYPSRLKKEKFQALENLTGHVDHFVYCIDIIDSLCDKFPIENNSLSGNPTLSPDLVVESLSPSLTPSGEIDLLLEETDAFLSLDDSIPPGIDNGIYDSEGDILFLEELLNDEITRDLPPKELKDDESSTTKSLIKKPLEIDNETYNYEGDILFLENLLKYEPSEADKSEIYTLKAEPPDTFLMEDEEIKLNPLKDSDDSVPIPRVSVTPLDSLDFILDSYDTSYTNLPELDFEYTLNYDNLIFNIQNEHCDEHETETIMDEVHSTVQIPPLFKELTSDKSM
ncbi:reverse transcriptase domain-containing protein [Tanacetum coccineum]